MKKRCWTFIIISLLIIHFLSCKNNPQQAIDTTGNRPPNVIIIMTDDQGYGDIAVHGNPFIETPQILSGNNDIELKEYGLKPPGRRIKITKAKLKINDIEKEALVKPAEESVTFSVDLKKGVADIQTWFYTETGDTLGAYYVYARLKNGRAM